uniref:RRM domain-containing protein n=1 Tax=Grammatophora oceanica TaxID=210454 RepID=A0A7S1VM38_9STRA|mmetsp:Transcript_50305/g.75157  ORF Transcript_50305/g.75157 Transcript_50305/m.75157 type:complete len:577 (+) Transcript_50305:231-1961(+)|eukprot:CAMPEP_0194048976 /NCGR_PEP_ID=MMETSP0009_2-20130614/29242_1 /TAXON_ID=210454 /ORGANISM="Grammatophora oceanica, Strain CCMP 410" /LENGTH=576 /DNA_ID=CAMNT_0038695021 /DNA_START=231 /DNA_END=1961 /DNA_ORIENTATION=+
MAFNNVAAMDGNPKDDPNLAKDTNQTTEAESEKSREADESPKDNGPVQTAKSKMANDAPASPATQPQLYQPAYGLPHLTPQPGYYMYGANHHVTPEPPSPAASVSYDPLSFLQQQAALQSFSPAFPQAPPLSPSGRSGLAGGLPPPSPLFPRVAANSGDDRPVIPMSPQLGGTVGVYANYAGTATQSISAYPGLNGSEGSATPAASVAATSASDVTNWADQRSQTGFPQASPQFHSQNTMDMGYSRAASGTRSTSFDEMLPPAMLPPQSDPTGAPYSPYAGSQPSPRIATSPMYTGQGWHGGYGAGASDPYQQSPVQARTVMPMAPHHGYPQPGMHTYGSRPIPPHYGHPNGGMPFYPATSPGPPIQTTASNKGPDGANLFIFHIPNHFTNMDMYNLFCQYGNLLSVRIMVEKDTGRSRGFGFVSYDSPESAAMAIKELNGFAIGNKRLKVQHKQIRAGEQRSGPVPGAGPYGGHGDVGSFHGSSNPPTNPASNPSLGLGSTPWYDAATSAVPPQGDSKEENGGSVEAASALPPPLPGCEPASASNSLPGLSPLTASLEPLRNALPDVHTGVQSKP